MAAKRKPVIKTVNLSKRYQMGETIVKAVDRVNLEIYSGEFVIIFGPSGCGKSTLMSLVAGLDQVTEGKIYIRGEDLSTHNLTQLAKYRRTKIGMVFQSYNLIQTMNAIDNISLPLAFDGANKRKRYKRAKNVLDMIGIVELKEHTPAEMSGGQQQKVGIARAWVGSPWIVLADEPTGNLDSKSADDVMNLLKSLNRKSKRTVIVITHNPEYLDLADRVVYLKDGRILRITGEIKAASKRKKRSEVQTIKGVGKTMANNLVEAGIKTMLDLASAEVEEISRIKGISKDKAKKLKKEAEVIMEAREGTE